MVQPRHDLETVFGTIGAVLWSLQLCPQIWKTYRRRDSEGASTALWGIWYASGLFLGAYNIKQDLSLALQIQPQFFCFFSAVAFAQGVKYDYKSSTMVAWLSLLALTVGGGAVEVGFYYAAEADKSGKVAQAWGLLSAILIVVGLLPQYWEVYRARVVLGISYVFLLVDMSGGLFSILSLVWTEGDFDAVASASYAAVIVLEAGLFALVPILNPSYHRRQALLKREDTEATAVTPLDEVMAINGPRPKEPDSAPKEERRDP